MTVTPQDVYNLTAEVADKLGCRVFFLDQEDELTRSLVWDCYNLPLTLGYALDEKFSVLLPLEEWSVLERSNKTIDGMSPFSAFNIAAEINRQRATLAA
jgi:hypothetical protein